MLSIRIASRSEVGERSENEDDLRTGGHGVLRYAVLSDGAGGHENGAIASDLVVRGAVLALQDARCLDAHTLVGAINDANTLLAARQRGAKARQRMHATVVALWIDVERHAALWAHVGDSRLYLVRQGKVRLVTRDDSLVQQMVDAKLISAEEARTHPRKNHLLAALGGRGPVEVHALADPFLVRDGDAFLLCSDGWWDALGPGAIEETLERAQSVDDWLDAMCEQVQSRADAGQDNYSAVGVWLGDPDEVTQLQDIDPRSA